MCSALYIQILSIDHWNSNKSDPQRINTDLPLSLPPFFSPGAETQRYTSWVKWSLKKHIHEPCARLQRQNGKQSGQTLSRTLFFSDFFFTWCSSYNSPLSPFQLVGMVNGTQRCVPLHLGCQTESEWNQMKLRVRHILFGEWRMPLSCFCLYFSLPFSLAIKKKNLQSFIKTLAKGQ